MEQVKLAIAMLLLQALAACQPISTRENSDASAEASSPALVAPKYPETRRDDVVDTLFGEKIAAPYRWLENDLRNDPEVADWVKHQNAVTEAYLAQLPARDWFRKRIAELRDFEHYSLPAKRGKRYFYLYNTGLQNQSPLYMREGLDGEPRLLIDPNTWTADAATALSGWEPSPDGTKLLYGVQEGGTDWRILRVLDVGSGTVLADEIKWAKFTGLAWVGEEGFLYSRFPRPEAGQDFQATNHDHAIYFHKLGTPQNQDQRVYATPEHREYMHVADVTSDGRWAIIRSIGVGVETEIHVIDLAARAERGWAVRELVTGLDDVWYSAGASGSTLWFMTNKDAPRFRIVSIDLAAAEPAWKTVVPEMDQTIDYASLIGQRLIVSYLKDASSLVRVFDLAGKQLAPVALGDFGNAAWFSGAPGDPEAFYRFSSFNRPPTVYRLDTATGKTSIFAAPRLTFDPGAIRVEQRFYASKDGTRVPMFIVRQKDAVGPAPTLLYGYGAFGLSQTPSFSPAWLAWVEAGGTFALANIRGGGEYGEAWHDAGRLANQQNKFDDFIAAAEFLKREGIASKVAIQGRSAGGTLVAAVANQRPGLFAAGNAAAGVMDMLRFDHWTAGRMSTTDFGDPSKEADFKLLRALSPLHNVKADTPYPALIATTADTDDRVVPSHSFKYVAALQAANLGPKPQLLRVETRAGHGSGKPTDKAIEEEADVLGFLAYWTGLEPPTRNAAPAK